MGRCPGTPRLRRGDGGRLGAGGRGRAGPGHRRRRGAAGREVERALAAADLVVVENLCSLPLNPAASAAVAAACAGRPTVLHHHDLPWQRAHLAHLPPPPDDPAWAHVTINELSRRELADRGLRHVGGRSYRRLSTIYNTFDPNPLPGDRAGVRRAFAPGGLRSSPPPTNPRAGTQERARRRGPHRGGRRRLLVARSGRGRLRTRTGACRGQGPLPCPLGRATGRVHRSPMPTARATPLCCPRRGRASATPRSSPPPTGVRWPSGPTRWPRSWLPSASAGSTRSTRPDWVPGSLPPTRGCSSTTTPWRPAASIWPISQGAWAVSSTPSLDSETTVARALGTAPGWAPFDRSVT